MANHTTSSARTLLFFRISNMFQIVWEAVVTKGFHFHEVCYVSFWKFQVFFGILRCIGWHRVMGGSDSSRVKGFTEPWDAASRCFLRAIFFWRSGHQAFHNNMKLSWAKTSRQSMFFLQLSQCVAVHCWFWWRLKLKRILYFYRK